MLQTLPPALILFSIDHPESIPGSQATSSNQKIVEAAIPNFWDGLQDNIANHPFLFFGMATAYLVILNGVLLFIRDMSDGGEEIDSEGLLTLFETLEKVVGAKATRFGGFIKKLHQGKESAVDVFNSITKPDQQIIMLVAGLHSFFDAIDSVGVNIRVCLISAKDGIPNDFYYYYPESEPPKASIEELQLPESTAATAIRKKRMVIVPDVQEEVGKENGQYVGDDSGQEERSLICYPVIHHYTSTVPYVIAVVADKSGYFKTTKKQIYNWIFRHFAVRIALEHSLLLLKAESVKEESGNHE